MPVLLWVVPPNRTAIEDIQVADKHIPQGSVIMLNMHTAQQLEAAAMDGAPEPPLPTIRPAILDRDYLQQVSDVRGTKVCCCGLLWSVGTVGLKSAAQHFCMCSCHAVKWDFFSMLTDSILHCTAGVPSRALVAPRSCQTSHTAGVPSRCSHLPGHDAVCAGSKEPVSTAGAQL